ncbi:MAG: MFS transporter [Candidatus Hodarchaeales archaeon]|jgi:MFS family permease
MIFSPLITYLGVKELPRNSQGLIQKFFFILILMNIFGTISSTFYVLFVLDIVGYAELGFLLSLSFIGQAVLDYPSGAIGDWIGQRWVLFIAYLFYFLSFLLLSISNSMSYLIVVYILFAVGSSQQSGAMNAWFDNNYKASASEKDPKSEIYRLFQGRLGMIFQLTGAIMFVVGGLIATFYFRTLVFKIQALGMISIAFICLLTIKDFPEVEKTPQSLRKYFQILGEGIGFVITKKYMMLFFTGIILTVTMWSVWGYMILFPMYFSYTGSDFGASIYRFFSWVIAIPFIGLAGQWSKKLEMKKWLPLANGLQAVVHYTLFLLIFILFPIDLKQPITGTFMPVAIILTLIVFSMNDIWWNVAGFLEQSFMLNVIPDESRNSIYSLIPTLVLIANAPALLLAGLAIESVGIQITMIILGACGVLGAILKYYGLKFAPKEIIQKEKRKLHRLS